MTQFAEAIEAARAAMGNRDFNATDEHLRAALACANRMSRGDLRARVMRCRNRLRPVMMARWA